MTTIFQIFKQIGFFTTALTLALMANFAYGQWLDPTQTAPNGNITAPINTSSADQIKTGDLGIDNMFAADTVYSDEYCNLRGTNCATFAELVNQPTQPTQRQELQVQTRTCTDRGSTARCTMQCGSGYLALHCNGTIASDLKTCTATATHADDGNVTVNGRLSCIR